MAALLDEALDAGMLGMSGMDAAIDKLDGDRFRSRALPSTFATWRERRRLIKVLRKRGRILQSAPDVDSPVSALMFFLTSSRILNRRKGVRMSLLVSADAKAMPLAVHVFGRGTRLLNKLLGSSVRFQHLPVPFELYSDGIDLPVFEEFGAGTAALHLRDQIERNELLADESYRRRFRREFDRMGLTFRQWTAADGDARLTDHRILASIHRAVHGANFERVAETAPWDVLIVDECHHLSATPQRELVSAPGGRSNRPR